MKITASFAAVVATFALAAATPTTSPTSNPTARNSGMRFNGQQNQNRVILPNTNGNSPLNRDQSSFTIEAWIKPRSKLEFSTIFGNKMPGWTGDGFFFHYNWYASDNGLLGLESKGAFAGSTVPVSFDVWQHVAVAYESCTGVVTFYIDGLEVPTNDGGSANIHPSSNNFVIGQLWSYPANANFFGDMDEFRYWSYARTASQIQSFYDCGIDPTADGLLAYYTFEEGSNLAILEDASGNGIHGNLDSFAALSDAYVAGVIGDFCPDSTTPAPIATCSPTVSPTTQTPTINPTKSPTQTPTMSPTSSPAVRNSGMQFNGLRGQNRVILANTNGGSPLNRDQSSFTIEAWIKPQSKNDFCTIFSNKMPGYGGDGFFFHYNSYNTRNGILGLESKSAYAASTVPVTFGVWQHVAVTYEFCTGAVSFYINGLEVPSNGGSANIHPSSYNFVIGQLLVYSNNANFDGDMDELRYWSYARTANQIQSLYDCQVDPTTDGLLAYYTFEEGSDPAILEDASGNGIHGTLDTFAVPSDAYVAGAIGDMCPDSTTPVPAPPCSSNPTASPTNIAIQTPTSSPTKTPTLTPTTPPTSSPTERNSGMRFNGQQNQNRVILTNTNGIDSPLNLDQSSFTIEAWIKPQSKNDFCTIFSNKMPGYGGDGFFFHYNTYNTRNGILGLESKSAFAGTTVPVTFDVWQHVAVTYEFCSGAVTFYINGLEVPSNGGSANIHPSSYNFVIGQLWTYPGGNSNFKGDMDELRYWSYARSATQIQSFYDCEIDPTADGLLAYYTFEEGSDPSVLEDSSGNGIHGGLDSFAVPLDAYVAGAIGDMCPHSTTPAPFAASCSPTTSPTSNPTMLPTLSPTMFPTSSPTERYSGIHFNRQEDENRVMLENTNGNSPLNLDQSSFTIEVWIKPQSKNDFCTIFGNKMPNYWGDGFFFHYNSYNTWNGRLGLESKTAYAGTTVPVTFDVWQHVAVTYEFCTGVITFYINGTEVPSNGGSANIRRSSNNFVIGQLGGYPGNSNFFGDMDELRYWSYARTATQIQTFYDCQVDPSEDGLLAYYMFEEGSDPSVLEDASGNGFHGSLDNFADPSDAYVLGAIRDTCTDATIPAPFVTCSPTMSPTLAPTQTPTSNPTKLPTLSPTMFPTSNPTVRHSGMRFNGLRDQNRVILPNTSGISPLNRDQSSFTIEAWIKPKYKYNFSTILSNKMPGYGGDGFFFHYNSYNTRNGVLGLESKSSYAASTVPVTFDVWQHVAVTYEFCTGVVSFYINGLEVPTNGGSADIRRSLRSLVIGQLWGYSGNANFEGGMDELRYWSYARTADQIQSFYDCGIDPTAEGLLAYYTFEEGSNLLLLEDASGNGIHGTLDSFAVPSDAYGPGAIGDVCPDSTSPVPAPLCSRSPTMSPTAVPSANPTIPPTTSPTHTRAPTMSPSAPPTSSPTNPPTASPTLTSSPTMSPSSPPTSSPTNPPSRFSTSSPTTNPTQNPIAATTPTGSCMYISSNFWETDCVEGVTQQECDNLTFQGDTWSHDGTCTQDVNWMNCPARLWKKRERREVWKCIIQRMEVRCRCRDG